jgi:hypothetical protein
LLRHGSVATQQRTSGPAKTLVEDGERRTEPRSARIAFGSDQVGGSRRLSERFLPSLQMLGRNLLDSPGTAAGAVLRHGTSLTPDAFSESISKQAAAPTNVEPTAPFV